jgi:hypothetical protein
MYDVHLSWAAEPVYYRVFAIYLVVEVVIAAALIGRVLGSFYLAPRSPKVAQTSDASDQPTDYRLRKCAADVALIERFGYLTILLSFMVAVHGLFPTWGDMFNNAKITGLTALFKAVSLSLDRLEIGLVVAALLLFVSALVNRAIALRLASHGE